MMGPRSIPFAFDVAFKESEHPRDEHGRFASDITGIQKAIAELPGRIAHFDTRDVGFYIAPDGEILSFRGAYASKENSKKLVGSTGVHSHIMVGKEGDDIDTKLQETFSKGDLHTYADQARRFGVFKQALITSPNTMDVIVFSRETVPSKEQIERHMQASYEDREKYQQSTGRNSNEFYRDSMAALAKERGFEYHQNVPIPTLGTKIPAKPKRQK